MTEFAPLSVPVIGELEELEGFEDVQKEIDVSGQVAGGGGQVVQGGGGAGAEALFAGAELGSDVATGAQGAGIAGRASGALGGMSAGLMAILGVLTVIAGLLLMMEPIQEFLGLIWRTLEFAVIPLIAPLIPVMEKIKRFVVDAVNLFRNPGQLFKGLEKAMKQIVNAFAGFISKTVPGVTVPTPFSNAGDIRTRSTKTRADAGRSEQTRGGQLKAMQLAFGLSNPVFAGQVGQLAAEQIIEFGTSDVADMEDNEKAERQKNVLEQAMSWLLGG